MRQPGSLAQALDLPPPPGVPYVALCAGPLVVKAGIWALVEQLYQRGHTKLYSGWPQTWQQVGISLGLLPGCRCSGGCWAAGASRTLRGAPARCWMARH